LSLKDAGVASLFGDGRRLDAHPEAVGMAGFIGGDALYGFFDSVIKTAVLKVK
jgi:hypothetical protein